LILSDNKTWSQPTERTWIDGIWVQDIEQVRVFGPQRGSNRRIEINRYEYLDLREEVTGG
jgi:hypothetical protein